MEEEPDEGLNTVQAHTSWLLVRRVASASSFTQAGQDVARTFRLAHPRAIARCVSAGKTKEQRVSPAS
eukprot:scaffold77893_cov60-Phaeocystis_antarctica.AAC.1